MKPKLRIADSYDSAISALKLSPKKMDSVKSVQRSLRPGSDEDLKTAEKLVEEESIEQLELIKHKTLEHDDPPKINLHIIPS